MLVSIFIIALGFVGLVLSNGSVFSFRGGHVQQAPENNNKPSKYYFEQFELDYGTNETFRLEGKTKGFVKQDIFRHLKCKNSFTKWIMKRIENGVDKTSTETDRIKPFYVSLCLSELFFDLADKLILFIDVKLSG